MKYNFDQCIGNRLRRLSRIVDKDFRASLKDYNITENQLTILFALRKKGRTEQGKIGEALVLERSTMSRNAKLLEKNGIIIRTTDYRPEIELTKKGEDLVETLIPVWENLMDVFSNKLGAYGMQNLSHLEDKLK